MKIALACAAAALFATPAAAQNLWISGGPIYTGVAERPTAEAVIVQDGKITFVGDAKTIRFKLNPGTETIDLKGAALFPGFTDAHAHLYYIGERELSLSLEGSKSA